MDIETKLTSEQEEQIKQLREALEKQIQQEQNPQFQYQELADLTSDTQKVATTPSEIVFDITAKVLSENEKGETVNTKEIMTKKFHIPVPIDKDHNKFMNVFFKHIEEALLDSTKKAYEEK